MTPCDHEAIKSDPVKWATETYPIGDGPVMDLEWANCRRCESTLARPVGEVDCEV